MMTSLAGIVVGLVVVSGVRVADGAGSAAKGGAESRFAGVWTGTTIAICPGSIRSRCNAHQKVTIALAEGANGKLGGYYKCAYGNSNCYNMNETGKVGYAKVTDGRLWVRVIMPDGSSCLFNGMMIGGGSGINGGYSCSVGGASFERGSWRAKREM
jgi:hypothetical protein